MIFEGLLQLNWRFNPETFRFEIELDDLAYIFLIINDQNERNVCGFHVDSHLMISAAWRQFVFCFLIVRKWIHVSKLTTYPLKYNFNRCYKIVTNSMENQL